MKMYLAVHLCTLYDQFLAHTRENEAVFWLEMVRAGPSSSQHCPPLASTGQLVSGEKSGGGWALGSLATTGQAPPPGLQSAHTNLPLLYSGVEIRP